MTLTVKKVSEAYYTATASAPHAMERWETEQPLRMHQLLESFSHSEYTRLTLPMRSMMQIADGWTEGGQTADVSRSRSARLWMRKRCSSSLSSPL